MPLPAPAMRVAYEERRPPNHRRSTTPRRAWSRRRTLARVPEPEPASARASRSRRLRCELRRRGLSAGLRLRLLGGRLAAALFFAATRFFLRAGAAFSPFSLLRLRLCLLRFFAMIDLPIVAAQIPVRIAVAPCRTVTSPPRRPLPPRRKPVSRPRPPAPVRRSPSRSARPYGRPGWRCPRRSA